MEIGMLTTGYPHEGDPVAGAFVRGMARSLAARGHGVRVLCAARPGDHPKRDSGVTVVPVAYRPGGTFYGAGAPHTMVRSPGALVGGGVFTLALAHAAMRTLQGCDALVSHFVLPCGLVGGWLRAGRPHLAVVHGTDGLLLARCPRWFQRRVLRGATAVQYSHEGLRRALTGAVPGGTVRPMGFDPVTLPRVPRQGEGTTVLSVGRLVALKRVELVIAAVALCRSQGSPVSLVVVGDGPARGRLEALAGRGAGVAFTGTLDSDGRDAWLARADVFLHTAGEGEGAPVAVLEAMGAGLPVVATEGGGVRELVGEGGVVLAGDGGSGTVRLLAGVLTALAVDPARRATLGAMAKARAWPLRWEAEAERIERVLRNATDG